MTIQALTQHSESTRKGIHKTIHNKKTQKAWRAIKAIVVASRCSDGVGFSWSDQIRVQN